MMRLCFYLVCAAFVVVGRGDSAGEPPNAAPGRAFYPPGRPRPLQPLDLSADVAETVADFALPRWAAKFRPGGRWSAGTDPRKIYLLADVQNDEPEYEQMRAPRNKRYNLEVYQPRQTRYFNMEEEPSLSISAPIQSLRKVYAKERLRQRIAANREFLNNLRDSQ